jgi:hypothetical protein
MRHVFQAPFANRLLSTRCLVSASAGRSALSSASYEETVFVRDPAFVDGFIFSGNTRLTLPAPRWRLVPRAIVRADRWPDSSHAGAVAERLRGQGPTGHKGRSCARQFRSTDPANETISSAATDHAQLHHASQLLGQSVRSRLHWMQRDISCTWTPADRLPSAAPRACLVARFALAVAHSQVLQLAFAALIADGAIERSG